MMRAKFSKFVKVFALLFLLTLPSLMSVGLSSQPAYAEEPGEGITCPGRVLTFPYWYRGLRNDSTCSNPLITELSDVWTIVLNVVEILLQLVGYISAAFILWGGVKYTISGGEPDKIASAKATITNAIVGLIIAIMSVAIVNFVAAIV